MVRPILDTHFPNLPHSAALIGSGSEVLRFDDATSTDHDWGPRVQLFLYADDHTRYATAIHKTLAHNLPYQFGGYSTNFSLPDPNDNDTQLAQAIEQGAINHRITIDTTATWFASYLDYDIDQPLRPSDWLRFSAHRLRTATGGAIYHDGVGLQVVRDRLAYYPHDVWLYLMAAQWSRIGEEEHLMGRAGSVNDEVGAGLIAARLVRDIMNLCFLLERTYAPYQKWFGTAFKQLQCGERIWPDLLSVLSAESWQQRENHLVVVYETIAQMHNQLGVTERLPETVIPFFDRPFRIITHHGFASALLKQIRDPDVQRLAQLPLIGSIDQFSDNTTLVSNPHWLIHVQKIFG